MTSPARRFRSLPPGRRRLLEFEVVAVATLILITVLVRDGGGVWQAVGLAALGYAVGLTAHVILVLVGWEPHGAGRRRER